LVRQRGFCGHLAPATAPSLDHDRYEVWLLHGPYTLDQLGDRNRVGLLYPEHDERLGDVVRKLCLVVKIQLLEALQDVIEAAQTLPPF